MMNARKVIHSVGIDIGTTTTQVIFSELELVNRAPASQVPYYEFARRDISYVSPVVSTAMDEIGVINQDKLHQFIHGQYQAAGLKAEDVESGAIIITGETSKAKNARPAIMELAKTLGDFVVATAGPHLESIIAGQGSGAAAYSKEHACTVLNIDIGGGTANYAVFENGQVIDSACLNVGGHLVETDENGRITVVRAPARILCEDLFGAQFDPMQLSAVQLDSLMEVMAGLILEVAKGEASPVTEKLLMTNKLKSAHRYQCIFLSGGVAECYYAPETIGGSFVFKDTGPLLAQALHRCPELVALTTVRPNQTVRATVIGAGAYTLSLSGSTIWLNAEQLPIKNVPVVHPGLLWAQAGSGNALVEAWALAATRMDLEIKTRLYALALPADVPVRYENILVICQALRVFSQQNPNPNPLLVISRQDIGKVLGMELQPYLNGRSLAVVDEVETRDGDYVDIGKPFFGGDVVPLTVKSLAFPA